jgi:hypothetical protein
MAGCEVSIVSSTTDVAVDADSKGKNSHPD